MPLNEEAQDDDRIAISDIKVCMNYDQRTDQGVRDMVEELTRQHKLLSGEEFKPENYRFSSRAEKDPRTGVEQYVIYARHMDHPNELRGPGVDLASFLKSETSDS